MTKMKGPLARRLSRAAFAAPAVALLGGCAAVIGPASFFPPQVAPPAETLQSPPGYVMTSDLLELPGLGRVHVVRLDNLSSETTIIYSGGNGSFTASGGDIILYDYPGRGGTALPATIDAAIATGPALVAALRQRQWIGRGPLFAYGVSFGGSQAAAMARAGGFAGIILEGTAADIAKVGRNFVPAVMRPFVRLKVDPELSRFEYLDYAVAAKARILLVSSQDDRVVTPRNMRAFESQLRERGAEVTWVSVPGPHGLALRQQATQAVVREFVKAD